MGKEASGPEAKIPATMAAIAAKAGLLGKTAVPPPQATMKAPPGFVAAQSPGTGSAPSAAAASTAMAPPVAADVDVPGGEVFEDATQARILAANLPPPLLSVSSLATGGSLTMTQILKAASTAGKQGGKAKAKGEADQSDKARIKRLESGATQMEARLRAVEAVCYHHLTCAPEHLAVCKGTEAGQP